MNATSTLPLRLLVLLAALLGCACDGARPAAPAAPPGTAEDVLARVTREKKLKVGVKADTPPFGSRAGDSFVGFDIDIAMAVARQLGVVDVEFVPVTSSDRIKKLLDGEVDMVVASMTITRYRDIKVDFSLPYFQDGQALLVKTDSPLQSYLDLAGKTVGCVRGSTSGYYMKQVQPDSEVKKYADFAAMITGLQAGEVDAISSDLIILRALLKGQLDPNAYRIAGERFTTEPYGIAIVENQSDWRDAINEAIQVLWETGRWQVIYDSWFGPGTAFESSKVDFVIEPYPH